MYETLLALAPWLIAMAVLLVCSAFFSASEAALFYLHREERQAMESGGPAERMAAALLHDPERLLSAILFWNLVINVFYFALASMAGFRIERSEAFEPSAAVAFTAVALLAIIFFGEMVPKSVGVLLARRLSALLAPPLLIGVRLVDPIMPLLRGANLFSQRLLWPRFTTEPYLETADLERAIELSARESRMVEQEYTVLRNIVAMSELRADEWMRPRTHFVTFRPPVALADLEGELPPGGYLLVTEPDSEVVASALHLANLAEAPAEHLEHYAEPVVYVPWCAPLAKVLETMQRSDHEVAAVVNEFGETVGIITFDDLGDTVFSDSPSRAHRLLDRQPILPAGDGLWHVAGFANLSRLSRYFGVQLPESRNVTLGGVLQEVLQEMPREGDRCVFGPFELTVLEAPEQGPVLVELRLRPEEPEE